MYLCIYLGIFLIFFMQKACNAKIIYSRPLQTKSILILDKNFVQKFPIKSIRLPTLLILQTICVHLEIFFLEFSKETHAASLFQKFHKEEKK